MLNRPNLLNRVPLVLAMLVGLGWAAMPAAGQCPPAPTALSVLTSGCANTLTWSHPGSVLQFHVFRGSTANFAQATQIAAPSGGARTYADTPPGGIVWRYWVRGMGAPIFPACPTGEGVLAGPVLATATGLAAPNNLIVTSTLCGYVSIAWDAVPGATSYHIIFDTPAGPIAKDTIGNRTDEFWSGSSISPPTRARVWAINTCGEGAPATLSLAIDSESYAITALSASSPQSCQILVQWTPDARHTGRYEIDRSGNTQGAGATFDVGPGATSYIDTTAMPGIQYTYRVTARSTCNFGFSNLTASAMAAAGPTVENVPPARVARGGTATLTVPNAPTGSGFTYSWRRSVNPDGTGGTAIANGGRFAGTSTPTLTITNIHLEDNDLYAVTVASSCPTRVVVTAVTVPVRCAADYDGSGAIGVQDIFSFLTDYFAGCP